MNYKFKLGNDCQNFKDFLLNIQSFFTANTQTIHKARNELKIIDYEGFSTVVKSFKVPHLLNRIVYTYFKKSKAKKSFEYSLKIATFTPKPIGFIEFYHTGLLEESYFVSEQFEYDFTIREPLLDKNFENREEIFKAFTRFTLELHNANIFHKDYSPGNILIKKENATLTFKIVDINRMKFFKLTERDRALNFSKLWANDEVLTLIAEEYQKHYPSKEDFTKRVLYYSNKNKRIKNFKKWIKGEMTND
jgi:Lipopolysaccharide kinase (Kdo/WaaP) family